MKLSNFTNINKPFISEHLRKVESSSARTRATASNFTIINLPLNNSFQQQYDEQQQHQGQQQQKHLESDPGNNDGVINKINKFETQSTTFYYSTKFFCTFHSRMGLNTSQ
eukprot:UN08507